MLEARFGEDLLDKITIAIHFLFGFYCSFVINLVVCFKTFVVFLFVFVVVVAFDVTTASFVFTS